MKFDIHSVSGDDYSERIKQLLGEDKFVEQGHTERPYRRWIGGTVEISTLEDLMKLIGEVGEIVIHKDGIVIYDDYME